ncbi:MAG: MarR family winged helix-turn-helix transcriptional regulator [Xanthobacteraceae bacterium]
MSDSSKLVPDHYLPYLVNRVGVIIAEQFGAKELAPRMTIAMWRVMVVLAEKGDQRQVDLSSLTNIDASSLSRLVTRMTTVRLVSRTRSTNSSREVVVKLTTKSHTIVARLFPRLVLMRKSLRPG